MQTNTPHGPLGSACAENVLRMADRVQIDAVTQRTKHDDVFAKLAATHIVKATVICGVGLKKADYIRLD